MQSLTLDMMPPPDEEDVVEFSEDLLSTLSSLPALLSFNLEATQKPTSRAALPDVIGLKDLDVRFESRLKPLKLHCNFSSASLVIYKCTEATAHRLTWLQVERLAPELICFWVPQLSFCFL